MDSETAFWIGTFVGILLTIATLKAKAVVLRYFDERYGGR